MESNLDLKAKETALLIVDIQNDYCTEGSHYHKLGYPIRKNCRIAQKIKKVINALHDKKIKIYYLISNYDDYKIKGVSCGYCQKNTLGAEPYIIREKADRIIIKNTHDGFYKTKLDYYLKKDCIKNLIISGISSSVCVDTTARAAVCRGFDVVILEDAVISRNHMFHKFALKNFADNFGYVMYSKKIFNLIHD